jgi:hypothetical protein
VAVMLVLPAVLLLEVMLLLPAMLLLAVPVALPPRPKTLHPYHLLLADKLLYQLTAGASCCSVWSW